MSLQFFLALKNIRDLALLPGLAESPTAGRVVDLSALFRHLDPLFECIADRPAANLSAENAAIAPSNS